tara:strand:- start:182 stop:613 length:432 start_codon:yes stop_codon:yes gene_type:complete
MLNRCYLSASSQTHPHSTSHTLSKSKITNRKDTPENRQNRAEDAEAPRRSRQGRIEGANLIKVSSRDHADCQPSYRKDDGTREEFNGRVIFLLGREDPANQTEQESDGAVDQITHSHQRRKKQVTEHELDDQEKADSPVSKSG